MPEIIVRAVRPAEYERVGELTVAAYVAGGLISPDSDYVARLRDAADRAARAELLVAEVGGEVVGAVAYCPPDSPYAELTGPGEGEFRMLAVDPPARGGGIGRALVLACLNRAEATGMSAVRLSTQPDMLAAHRLYERLGFVRTPERDWFPEPDTELITYVLKL
ncbi:GNAT family N-acetyltransferase [Actinomadura craniellae]|uniref:GNAT family N-acetyltransferase n=2 Tax=Actinomadura craniellae TaxID=2231787 RepID=A0A365H354_9ACTN|nr:GNAT family N-acetyltransferase [Actinomadura craniellae]